MYDWTEDRYECIQYMLENSGHHWAELNAMSDDELSTMVRTFMWNAAVNE